MKKFFLVVVLILLLNLVSASFIVENITVEENYGPGEKLRGWLNISLQSESADSLLSAFDSNISILDFLKNANAEYSCFPADCKSGYSDSAKETSKSFSLNFGEKKTIGLKVTGEIKSISAFSMNIASTASESSYPQLFIDILDNNELEWRAYSPSNNFLSADYGCYTGGSEEAEITQIEYCEKITLPYAANVKIGADIQEVHGKGGEADFEMRIYDEAYEYDESCTASALGSGKISCVVDLRVDKEQDFFVCIRTKNSDDNNKYSVNYEQNEPCGFSGSFNGNYEYDFAIFAQPGKYAPLGSFVLNNAELENAGSNIDIVSYIESYIYDKYKNDCTDSCVIPIRFISGKDQEITISNTALTYTTGISKTTHDIYKLEKVAAKIDIDFQKLDLEAANLVVPSSYGNKTLILELREEEIVRKQIEITKVPVINFVVPLNLPAAMSIRMIVIGAGATRYEWDFGDGETEETIKNSTYHTYESTGTYNLKITAINEAGKTSKTFSINVRSPKEEINRTLTEKKEHLNKIRENLEAITVWYREELEKIIALEDIEAELDDLEKRYRESDDYVSIMSRLLELKVPSIKSQVSSGDYLPNAEDIDLSYLMEISEIEIKEEKYKESIVSWINENMDLKIENRVYYLSYPEEEVAILTAVSLKIKARKELGETYLIIDRSYDEITFKEEYNEKAIGLGTAITFSGFEEDKEEIIEFIFQEKIDLVEMPIYISPQFSQLPEDGEIFPCNYNEICEKKLGENAKNCPSDCTNWKKIIIWLTILLSGAFVVYIALQEWYKRYYEKHLFKNKNDLFNLINFIINALNQGFSRKEVIKKLKEYGWKGEQIAYSYKKSQGKRTGMWEIPIFRPFEKRKLKRELEKRKKQGLYLPRQQGV